MSDTLVSFVPLLFVLGVIGMIIYFIRRNQTKQIEGASGGASGPIFTNQSPVIIRTFKGSQAEAMRIFKAASIDMAADGYFPTSQSWASGQWSTGAFIVAVLLIFLFGLGILILAYMLIVKPDGTLTVTFERRTASFEEKTCPMCAERIKAAALVCHFCGHKFAPGV